MFENDINLYGKHATYIKYLVNDAKIYLRYVDVYMNAAVLGFLNGKKSNKDNTSNDQARIYADALVREKRNLDFIYRLIMLLDDTDNPYEEEKVNKAFRYDSQIKTEKDKDNLNNNLLIFNSYVLGGIEFLFEKYTNGCSNRDDYIDRIFDNTMEFKDELERDWHNFNPKELIHS